MCCRRGRLEPRGRGAPYSGKRAEGRSSPSWVKAGPSEGARPQESRFHPATPGCDSSFVPSRRDPPSPRPQRALRPYHCAFMGVEIDRGLVLPRREGFFLKKYDYV